MVWFGDFTRAMTFSGSFTALRTSAMYPDGAWGYPALIMAAPLKPALRITLEVGTNDLQQGPRLDWLPANNNMAAAFMAKGYHYRFVTATGAGHCDAGARGQILPQALSWLWRGYQPN
jgi:hypothetical protein